MKATRTVCYIFISISALWQGLAFAQCTPTTTLGSLTTNACTFPENINLDQNYKVQQYNIKWPDDTTATRNNHGYGQCFKGTTCSAPSQEIDCWAQFDSPVGQSNGSWSQVVHEAKVVGKSGTNSEGQQCITYSCAPSGVDNTQTANHTCPTCAGTLQCPNSYAVCAAGGNWVCANGEPGCPGATPAPCCGNCYVTCESTGWTCIGSPIALDVAEMGFHFTDVAHGVQFRVLPSQNARQMSWPEAAFRNGWLALDRNGNGTIDDFTELFGNATPQPPSSNPNGYLALAVFDDPANGGNGNGFIDPEDAVYDRLRVWIDANHNGVSEKNELHGLSEVGIFRIDLKYFLSKYVDENGNEFRYKARVWDDLGKEHDVCYDVFVRIAY